MKLLVYIVGLLWLTSLVQTTRNWEMWVQAFSKELPAEPTSKRELVADGNTGWIGKRIPPTPHELGVHSNRYP